MTWRKSLIRTALGEKPADLVIVNGQLVNVNTREVYPGGVAITRERIAAVGDVDYTIGEGTKIIDAEGKYLTPGLIEGHIHTESSCVTITELSKILIPRGVTTILYAHEMANILGLKGMEVLRKDSLNALLKVYFQTPTSVPWAPGLEMPGTSLSVHDVEKMLDWKESAALGESDYFEIISQEEQILAKLDYAEKVGKPVCGHISTSSVRELTAAAAGAFHNDHENFTVEEALMKLRLGMGVMLREYNIPYIAPVVTEHDVDTQNLMLCIDDKLANTLAEVGGLDETVRIAAAQGIDPVLALQMATLNTAKHFRLDHHVGSLSPGRIGDVVITESLDHYQAEVVIVNGQFAAENGKMVTEITNFQYPAWMKDTVHYKKDLSITDFQIELGFEEGEAQVNVLRLFDLGYSKELIRETFVVSGRALEVDTTGEYNWIAVLERHGGDGKVALALSTGDVSITRGAVGSSVGHDCYNVTILGTNPQDMLACARAIEETGGGFAAVLDGEVIARVPLEIAGTVSQSPAEVVVDQINHFEKVIQEKLDYPPFTFIGFNFIVLQCSPFLAAITDRGLIDVPQQKVVPFVLSETPA